MPGLNAFDNHVQQYEAWFGDHPFAYVSELHAVQELLPLNGSGVEIGIGTGRFAIPLGIPVGIDPSRAMADLARKKGLEVIPGVAENLPFPDATYDFALMVTTICFLDDIDLAFQEVFRVLKPGGSFLIGLLDKNSLIGKLQEQGKSKSAFFRDATFYAVDDLLPRLTSTGFKIFNFRQTLFGPISDMREPSLVKEGYGEGSFVVIRADKDK